jgi:uncharacterized protein YneF (UPF0154 family)
MKEKEIIIILGIGTLIGYLIGYLIYRKDILEETKKNKR